MQAGIQISSFKPLMKDLSGLKRVLAFMKSIGCGLTQLQWIDKAIAPEEIAAALKMYGIRAVGVQDKAYCLFEDPDYYVKLCRATGAKDICLSGAVETGEERFLAGLTALRAREDARGLTFSYHPTNGDFDGALHRVMISCDSLRLTLDVCQAHDAGASLEDILRRYSGRVDAVHFKDRSSDGALCPVGQGVVNFETAARLCRLAGVKYLLTEQESWQDAFEELKQGFLYTQSLACKHSQATICQTVIDLAK